MSEKRLSYKIFISSNQKEFESERNQIKKEIENSKVSLFYEVSLFEDFEASGQTAQEIFLNQARNSDIYIGLIGEKYGDNLISGISATELEYNAFKEVHNDAWFFVKNLEYREDKTLEFLQKIEDNHKYVEYKTKDELIKKIIKTLTNFIIQKLRKTETKFDERIIPESSYEDVSLKAVQLFFEKNQSPVPDLKNKNEIQKILTGIKAGKIINNIFRLTNAGALFFAKDITKFSINHEFQMAHFQSKENINLIDNFTSKSPLLILINEMENFLMKNMKMGMNIEGFNRIDRPEYPPNAIRESVINALAHKDYEIFGIPITFYIYDNRLEVTSPGTLPPGLTIKKLGSKPEHRNDIICNLFKESKYMEKYGRGIPTMRREMLLNNLPEPEFSQDLNSFKVTFKGYSKDYNKELKVLNKRQNKALKMMINKNKKFTILEYMKEMNIKRSTASRDLNKLVNLKIVKVNTLKNNKKIFFIDDDI